LIAGWKYGKNYTQIKERWCKDIENEKTRYSYSRTTSFHNCKYEYYLNYVVNDDDLYFSEGNYYAEFGSYIHEILAMIFEKELKPEDALDYFIDNYDDRIYYKVRKSTMEKNLAIMSDYFATLDISWIDNYEILGVEKEVEFTVNGLPFIGFIDLLLRDKKDGRIVILDHKSAEYPFKKDGTLKKKEEKSFNGYKKQMYLYSHAIYQLYGEFPKEMTWNLFKDGGKFATIPFIKETYNETMIWFDDVIKEIEKEIEFEPNEDFFYCTNLCNFRNSCEYRLMSIRGSDV